MTISIYIVGVALCYYRPILGGGGGGGTGGMCPLNIFGH